jgi:hypothetical protein
MAIKIADQFLLTEIATVEQAKAYIDYLLSIKACYHFDESAKNIVDEKGHKLFRVVDCGLLDMRRAELFSSEFDWGQHDCPHGYVLEKLGL